MQGSGPAIERGGAAKLWERNDFSSNRHFAPSICFGAVPDTKVLHTFVGTALNIWFDAVPDAKVLHTFAGTALARKPSCRGR